MIKIICVGKIKEKYWTEAINEYLKRLSKYTKVNIIELDDDGSDDDIVSLSKEKDVILKNIKDRDYVITMEIEGEMYSSVELSEKIDSLFIEGNSDITFIIGSSYGLHSDIKKRSNISLSFSKMTFPHQLFRVILLEQIYRAFKILNNEKYHK